MTDETGVMSTGDRLIYMANQIARNLAAEGSEQAAAMVADHICHFWDPEMRRRILLLAQESPDALSPIAAAAIGRIAAV
jgi:formate dehydrogenase subunit delta